VSARAVAVLERRDDEVALGDAVHLCPDLLHHADELVADEAANAVRTPARSAAEDTLAPAGSPQQSADG